ncbi:hypothetical protein Ato02nite_072380 [Paractinoplanes toevensis]|uniref:Uncharacterized protein n=1 Tax=Paractinoplanes toevensis TaxID=571911 RepID=A0A919TH44_9ACTN|nr:hypothetical protein Ato02nite_072380 [Actinoplanes toevensis]
MSMSSPTMSCTMVQRGTKLDGRATDVDPSNVGTRDDFACFLSAVLADFRSTGEAEWENGTLDRFFDGAGGGHRRPCCPSVGA